MKSRAVFFDRDGVLAKLVIRDGKPHSARTCDELEWVSGAKEAVQALSNAGFFIFVVTNQPDIARKKMTSEILNQMNVKLISFFGGEKVIRAVYVCPHDDHDDCDCRKPKAGLLLRAAKEVPIDLAQSFIVGDRLADMRAGRQAGCKTILLEYPHNQDVPADFKINRIEEILPVILRLAAPPKAF